MSGFTEEGSFFLQPHDITLDYLWVLLTASYWPKRSFSVYEHHLAGWALRASRQVKNRRRTFHRRVHAELGRQGVAAGPELVRALMRQAGLVACQPRPWRHSLTQGGDAGAIPDRVGRDFTADAPGTKLVGDVTYVPTWQGWLYLATVVDCHTKAVVGYAMGDNYKTPLITRAITAAARNTVLADGAVCFTPIAVATTRQASMPPPSRRWGSASRLVALGSAMTAMILVLLLRAV